MRPHAIVPLLALSAVALLAGCGQSSSSSRPSSSATAATAMPSHTMSDGTVMPGASMTASTPGPLVTTTPSPTADPIAAMVCGSEIQDSIATLLKLPGRPVGTSTFHDDMFTCTYWLTAGPLVLSVQQSASPAAATGYLDGLRSGYSATSPIKGLPSLGLPAFQSANGVVGFAKDQFTLTVDATELTGTIGPNAISRSDLAYAVATDVLACWREH